jgi:serine/threonine protein kinase
LTKTQNFVKNPNHLFAQQPRRTLDNSIAIKKQMLCTERQEVLMGIADRIQSPTAKYEILSRLPFEGEVYDLYLARFRDEVLSRDRDVLVRVSSGEDVNDLAQNEARVLAHLNRSIVNLEPGNKMQIPELVESFELAGKQFVVTEYARRYYSLEEIRCMYPNGVPAVHVAWMFNRILTAMMIAHTSGVIHGAILPPHVLIHSGTSTDDLRHTVVLVDWTNAVMETSTNVWPNLSTMSSVEEYRCFYPPEVLMRKQATPQTDLAMAAGCAIYLLGGDVEKEEIPDTTPWNIAQLLHSCRERNLALRPRSIADFYDQLKSALRVCFGEPQFYFFELPTNDRQ